MLRVIVQKTNKLDLNVGLNEFGAEDGSSLAELDWR